MATQEQVKRVARFEKGLEKLEKECQLKIAPTLEFPRYKILPIEVQLAILVLKNHGFTFGATYKDIKEDK